MGHIKITNNSGHKMSACIHSYDKENCLINNDNDGVELEHGQEGTLNVITFPNSYLFEVDCRYIIPKELQTKNKEK